MTTYLPHRGNTYCSLGHLIDGQFADTYLQQAGLIFCRGSLRLAGIYRPDIGTVVDFAYTRDNVTAARIPRRLRVLSSFADPFTQITTVQIGCKLSLLQNSRQPDTATPKESHSVLSPGVGLNTNATDYVAPPVGALPTAQKCLTKLSITAASTLPLLNRYTVDNLDLSEGYVSVLGKLLESELYVGWLNEDEELEVRNLQDDADALGPVFNNTNVFTLSPIGVGELPAEFVNVTFNPLGLRLVSINEPADPDNPTEEESREKLDNLSGWNNSTVYGFPVVYRIDYTASGTPSNLTGSYVPVAQTLSRYENGREVETVTVSSKPYASVAGKYASQALSAGIAVPTTPVASRSIANKKYDLEGNVVEEVSIQTVSTVEFAGKLDLTFVFSSTDFVSVPEDGEVIEQATITKYVYSGVSVRQEVSRYVNWALTQHGQQSVSESRSSLLTSGDVSAFINSLYGQPAYEGTEVRFSDSGPQARRLPSPASLAQQVYGREPERTTKTVQAINQFGSVASNTFATFNLPYTSDDYFNNLVLGQWVTVNQSARAQALAINYGRIQNRLRLGNTQGVSLQIPVELMPTSPFDALYLQADGLTGQYRANGMSWTFDQNGIVGQVDALFWLATGQTGTPGTIWFPMPPEVTVLPTTPSVTTNGSPKPANSGSVPGGWDPATPDLGALFTALPTVTPAVFPSTLNVETGLEPYAETVATDAVTRSVFAVNEFPFSLAPHSDAMVLVTTSVFDVQVQETVLVPLATLSLTAYAPLVYAAAMIEAPLATLTLAAFAPTVAGAAVLTVPLAALTLTAFAPQVNVGAIVSVPLATLTVTAFAPQVSGASVVSVPLSALTLASFAPVVSAEAAIDVSAITYSQSSVYPGNAAATNAGMTNGVFAETTQTGTNRNAPAWVQMDLGAVFSVATVYVGADFTNTLAGGWGVNFTQDAAVEYSNDASSWTLAFNVATFTTGIQAVPVSFSARYVRIRRGTAMISEFLAVTEFYATGNVGAIVSVPLATLTVTAFAPTISGSFNPLSLSPVAWWDASDSGTVATGTGGVTDWDDKSGNGWHLTQGTSANRPTYTSAALNGLNVIEWASTDNDDFLVSVPGTFTFNEAFFVIRYDGGSTFEGFDGLFNYADNSGNGWLLGGGSGTNNFYLAAFAKYLNGDNGTDRGNLWPDIESPCLLRAVPTSTFSTSSGVVMGMDRLNTTLGRGWKGYICEVVVLSSVLSSGDRYDLEIYLINKWGI
jgi:hypothetical protein